MKIKLRQAFDLQMGKTPARNRPDYWNGDHKWISIADIGNAGKFLTKTKESITEAGIDGSGIKVVPQGTVIMSFKLSIGKTAITSEDMYTNEAIMAFIDNGKFAIDTDYLYHLCCGTNWTAGTNKAVMGLTLNKATLLEKEIPLPDINEQHEIATKLDKIDAIIAERQQQLELIDQAVKSRFIELFGDCDLTHPQESWVTIKEIGSVVGGATPKTDHDEYWGGSYRWITPAELDADSGYIYDSVRKLTKAGVESCSLQEMPVGTVILSSRAPIGKVAIAGNTFYCNQGFKNIICKEGITPRYLYTVLLLNVEYLNSLGRGATFKEISKGIVESIRIPVPSMELQEQFAAFVEQTDKSKYYSSLSFRYCQAAANTYRQEWMTCRTSDF